MATNRPYKGGLASVMGGCIYKDTPHRRSDRNSSGNFGRRFVRGVGMVSTRAWVAECVIMGKRYRYRSQYYNDCVSWLEKMNAKRPNVGANTINLHANE